MRSRVTLWPGGLLALLLGALVLLSSPLAQAQGTPKPAQQQIVRLVNTRPSGSAAAGRLELLVNGSWASVCYDYMDARTAGVVCRQLNYTGGAARPGGSYGLASPSQPSVYLWCPAGRQSSVSACAVAAALPGDCGPWDAAGVECASDDGGQPPTAALPRISPSPADTPGPGKARSPPATRVTPPAASKRPAAPPLAPPSPAPPAPAPEPGPPRMPLRLAPCAAQLAANSSGGGSASSGWSCSPPPPASSPEGLVVAAYGFLELVYVQGSTGGSGGSANAVDGPWGRVCGLRFDDRAAAAACRQLGYAAGGRALAPRYYAGPPPKGGSGGTNSTNTNSSTNSSSVGVSSGTALAAPPPVPLLLADVVCPPDAPSLGACRYTALPQDGDPPLASGPNALPGVTARIAAMYGQLCAPGRSAPAAVACFAPPPPQATDGPAGAMPAPTAAAYDNDGGQDQGPCLACITIEPLSPDQLLAAATAVLAGSTASPAPSPSPSPSPSPAPDAGNSSGGGNSSASSGGGGSCPGWAWAGAAPGPGLNQLDVSKVTCGALLMYGQTLFREPPGEAPWALSQARCWLDVYALQLSMTATGRASAQGLAGLLGSAWAQALLSSLVAYRPDACFTRFSATFSCGLPPIAVTTACLQLLPPPPQAQAQAGAAGPLGAPLPTPSPLPAGAANRTRELRDAAR